MYSSTATAVLITTVGVAGNYLHPENLYTSTVKLANYYSRCRGNTYIQKDVKVHFYCRHLPVITTVGVEVITYIRT